MHSVLSTIIAANEMDLYPENVPFKFIEDTHTQVWNKGKSFLKINRKVRVGKSQYIRSPWIIKATAHKQTELTFNDCHSN